MRPGRTSLAALIPGLIACLILFTAQTARSKDVAKEPASAPGKVTNEDLEYIVLPGLFSTPETGLGVGAGLFILSPPPEGERGSRGNAIKIGAIYTEKKQFVARGLVERYLNSHRDHLSVSLNAQKYPDSFFGVGGDTEVKDEEKYTSLAWDIQARYLHEINPAFHLGPQLVVSRERITGLKAGGFLQEQFDQRGRPITGVDPVALAGIGVVARHDTRDDLQDPDRGMFIEAGYLARAKFLGGEHEFTTATIDMRGFVPLTDGIRPLRYAWNLLVTSLDGEPPFQQMAALGGRDNLRGYFLGRYRDRKMLAFQNELRLPLPGSAKWGAVAYAATGNVGHDWQELTGSTFKPAWGAGARYRISTAQRVNIRLDAAWGLRTPSPAYYLSLAEAF
ncbi:MAG: hypothetical protein RIQ81_2044 [Pseudomonadota bacterium]